MEKKPVFIVFDRGCKKIEIFSYENNCLMIKNSKKP